MTVLRSVNRLLATGIAIQVVFHRAIGPVVFPQQLPLVDEFVLKDRVAK